MLYRVAADLVVIVHLIFVLFVLFGGFLMMKNRKWALLHLPAAVWASAIEFRGGVCPLTPLENWLRVKGGRGVYGEGFVEHYLVPAIYPSGLTGNLQVALGASVIGLNAVIYLLMLFERRHKG